MATIDFQRVEEIFEQVLDAAPDECAALLDQLCAGDDALRAEVESLIEHDSRSGDAFLSPPALGPIRARSAAWIDALIGKQIGHYTISRLIAEGGMGCVFEARQQHPARSVAIKVLHPGMTARSAMARFRLEPELLGRLQHPHIAQVYEAGVHEDERGPVPYFAMELIPDALPLGEYVETHNLSMRRRLALIAKVCDAVHHGHQKGIIHRDLKPGNILVGADGEPKVIDFGVARSTDADIMVTTQCTQVGDLIGTVQYMSPEQCDGDPAAIDTRSDVYSLGVVLYELLTCTTPYPNARTTMYAAIRAIKDAPPRPPSRIVRKLRGDLDAILLKTLEKDPARRYSSAAELAADIRRHLAGEPIDARPPTLATRLAKWAVRHPLVMTMLMCGVIVAATAVFVYIGHYWATRRPHRIDIVAGGSVAQLKTVAGVVLHEWDAGEPRVITFAGTAQQPAVLGGASLAIIAYYATMARPPYGCLAMYDLDGDLGTPIKTLALTDEDIPAVLVEREKHAPRAYRGRAFGVDFAATFDMFDDPPGVKADELVVIHKHAAVTPCALRVYRLDGELLYQVWLDAHVVGVTWLPESELLVCAGVCGTAYLRERGMDVIAHPTISNEHPRVVFAIRPKLGFVTSEFLEQEPARRHVAAPELRPAWYYMVYPPEYYDRSRIPSDCVQLAGSDFRSRGAVIFKLEVKASTLEGHGGVAGRCWVIESDGTVHDLSVGDLWEAHGQTPEHPDRPLPPYDAFYLGDLPPIVETD